LPPSAGGARRPAVTYPENLPITPKAPEIIRALQENQVVIISGETGSGKSTQIPKMCIEAGRGILGKIACTQPRRIAATTIAHRIAEEMGEALGRSVGYKIRFRDRTDPAGYIKIVTDGMLLAETQADPRLCEYDTLIIDEAHERSLNIDFLLGITKTLLAQRPELKLIITSATLDTEKFSAAFGNAPVVEVGGRMYPVEVEYMPVDPKLEDEGEVTYVDMAVRAVDRLRRQKRFGDVLVFMPTEQDILETCERLEGRQYPGVTVLPLFARLPGAQQTRVYSVTGQKIVVATNVAETSLTIPGIKYVVDTGFARISQYLPRTRTTSLPISPVSRSSADQRKGRCGRVQNGICIRLYSEKDYEARRAFTVPEILRSNLAEVILRMVFLNLGHPASFPFVDPPGARSIKDGFDLLLELGAVLRDGRDYRLTEKGRVMARMPLDPRISRMMLEASREGCVREVAVIASALSIQDPRERPLEKAALADQVHAPFRHPDSDFLTLLNIWNRYHRTWEALKTQNRMRKFCKENFLSFPRMREWVYIHVQILSILKEQKIRLGKRDESETPESRYARIHRSVLSGFLSNIAVRKEKNFYTAARGREAMVFPGSTLFNKKAPWIVAAEMVKTSRLFARTAAGIDPGWLEALGWDLCRSTYSDPHWEKNRGEVRAFEQVTLYGLVIVSGRPVSYGPIAPEEAHTIFVQSALVEGEVRERFPFLTHNLNLVKKLADMEDKVRRRDILVSDAVVADFYSRRIEGIYDIRTLKKRIKDRGGDDFLKLREEDLVLDLPDEAELALYPDELAIGETRFKTSYRFAPGKEEDGVTIRIPSSLASRIPAERLEWGVPGIFREKVIALIKGLPKRYRKQLVPVSGTADIVVKEMKPESASLLSSLARFVYHRFKVDIPASVWAEAEIPEHLRMRVALTDHRGREVESGRDIRLLGREGPSASPETDSAAWKIARAKWERDGLTTWDFEGLPESLSLGAHMVAYPALVPEEGGVNIRLFQDHDEALASHLKGVQGLLSLHLARDLKFLKRNWPLPGEGARGAAYFGGAAAVEKALHQGLLKSLFRKDLRDREAFLAHAETLKQAMFDKARELRDLTVKVLDAYHRTRSAVHALEEANKSNRQVLDLCGGIRTDLDALVPGDFLDIYPSERLAHIPRYLKAMEMRAVRGANDPEKDRIKTARVEGFIKACGKMREELSPHASREKREEVEAFLWMIEEFKISLFAQELGTPFPVSVKRLEEKRKEIERMV
jgi:ATP-dependent helicase HrpA